MPTTPPSPDRPHAATATRAPLASSPRTALVAGLLDLVAVLVFATVGRASHEEGLSVAGVLEVAWPFLAGLVAGWLVTRAWRRPLAVWPTAVGVLVLTWGGGMALRAATGAGTAASFLLVAAGFLALVLVGWRAVALGVLQARRPR